MYVNLVMKLTLKSKCIVHLYLKCLSQTTIQNYNKLNQHYNVSRYNNKKNKYSN